ncbi:TIGR03086 family metal-binding protein [Streptomyces sp. NBC_01549]|uniref:TIGR03086 family metal-binding protein n=1 Tax=Streptomyces sp. NBC_01549 TaxID=2975874 RepID=UPI002255DC8E|nr:TIGR03086 family metal-binding protein [Streptomyces sp. NBC_01549]MCX4591803.1 TIGR03086 family metal-binding protein [Streptomyces sp. NBC_01549]
MTESTDTAQASTSSAPSDPRTSLMKAVALAGRTLAAIRPEQYDSATPCPEYDVRALSNHLVSVLRRVAVVGAGGEFFSVPHFAEDVADGDWAVAWDAAAGDVDAVWSDPAVLDLQVSLPWGSFTGSAMALSYTTEFTLHTWDLATATGQSPEWDPEVLAGPLATMRQTVPAQPRGNPVPFGPVVEVPEDAPDIDKVVGWHGRRP